MRLWQKASAAFKDHHTIFHTNLSASSSSWCGCSSPTPGWSSSSSFNPDIDKAVILATSHSDPSFDRCRIHALRDWLRLSPYNLIPLLRALSRRMSRTRNWLVALKGLYLVHTLINSRLPCIRAIGRLPFDLSDFNAPRPKSNDAKPNAHAIYTRSWPFDAFVRAYYAFLDQKSALMYLHSRGDYDHNSTSLITSELAMLQEMQELIELLLKIRPQSRAAFVPIVLEVMDWILIEIYDLYSRICRGVAFILLNIYSSGKSEAKLALGVVQRATQQGEDLSAYFQYCRKLGVSYSSSFPAIDPIPEDGIHELEQIINTFSEYEYSSDEDHYLDSDNDENNNEGDGLKTIITKKWEKFDEEMAPGNGDGSPDLICL